MKGGHMNIIHYDIQPECSLYAYAVVDNEEAFITEKFAGLIAETIIEKLKYERTIENV